MRVLAACSLGGAGHLQPLLAFLDVARDQAHKTLVVGPPALTAMVEETGHPFAPGDEPPESVVAPIREQLPVAPPHEAAVLANRELFGRLATEAMLPAMEQVVRSWKPDLVLRDPCEYASAVVASPRDVSIAQIGIGLAEVEWGSIEIAAPALEDHRAGLVDELRGSPYVTRFPASLDPSQFPDTRRFREADLAPSAPLPDWWGGSQQPLVYVSFGTVLGHMSNATAAYRAALDAVGALDARVLLTVGRRFDASQLGEIPRHVHVEPWVDQADVFAEADVVVSHGGSGTTLGALRAGLPVVVVPLFADQIANGRKVDESGAGVTVDTRRSVDGAKQPLTHDDAVRIAGAIKTVRGLSSYRENARRVADEMATAPTVESRLDELLAR
jgi:hypothetical protein